MKNTFEVLVSKKANFINMNLNLIKFCFIALYFDHHHHALYFDVDSKLIYIFYRTAANLKKK